jgi:hypothetical protein
VTLGGVGMCAPVTAGLAYDLRASIYVPSGQNRTGTARLRLVWHQQPICNGLTTGTSEVVGAVTTSTTDQWLPVEGTGLVAPGGAQGAMVVLEIEKLPQLGGTLVANFDAVELMPEPVLAGWAALAALGLLARGKSQGAP